MRPVSVVVSPSFSTSVLLETLEESGNAWVCSAFKRPLGSLRFPQEGAGSGRIYE